MAKAKKAKKESVEKRFPQLAFDKREQIEDLEAKGWNVFQHDNGAWNAQHPDIAPVWMPMFAALDGLLKEVARVDTEGRPLTEKEQLGWGKDEPTPSQVAPPAGADVQTVGQMILTTRLGPSPTNPRKRFPKESLEELAASIREQGIIEPLVVREINKGGPADDRSFEIVCGERRYRAAVMAEFIQVPCIVRDLTDEQVLDIQIHENLHREDVHPMDEALGYAFLMKKLGCDAKELALRVGKTEAYVLNRMKLNGLIKEAQDDLDAGRLPIGHALEIAKFADPGVQQRILDDYIYDDWNDDKDRVFPLKETCTYINENILLQLTSAPFDIKATNLRSDGMACVQCPERTGAAPGLFEAYGLKKEDHCLNDTCFESKKEAALGLMKAAAAAEIGVKADKVPVVDLTRGWPDETGVMGTREVQHVGERAKTKAGDKVFKALSIAGDTAGQVVLVKRHADAVKTAANSSGTKTESEKKYFYQRKEEIWNVKVGEEVRKIVLRLAGEKFAQQFAVTGGGDSFLPSMVAQLYIQINSNQNWMERKIINEVVKPVMQAAMDTKKGAFEWHGTIGELSARTAKLSDVNQKLLLFLLVNGNKGEMYGGSYHSQKSVLALAKEWDIDYRGIDAKTRLRLSAKKHHDVHQLYADAIEAGKYATKVPRLYSDDWTPKD